MKIYLVSTAPSNESWREQGMLLIPNRLLSYYHISYYHIKTKTLESDEVFEAIKKLKTGGGETYENQ